jgi:hypothetical protein
MLRWHSKRIYAQSRHFFRRFLVKSPFFIKTLIFPSVVERGYRSVGSEYHQANLAAIALRVHAIVFEYRIGSRGQAVAMGSVYDIQREYAVDVLFGVSVAERFQFHGIKD